MRKEFDGGPRWPTYDAGRKKSRRARGRWIRGSRALGAILPAPGGRGRGGPRRSREADLHLEALVPVRGRRAGGKPEGEGFRGRRDSRGRGGPHAARLAQGGEQ